MVPPKKWVLARTGAMCTKMISYSMSYAKVLTGNLTQTPVTIRVP